MDNCNIFYSILPEGVTGGVGPELVDLPGLNLVNLSKPLHP